MNISFAGCGFLGLYHVGVASCLKTYASQLFFHKVSGASAGAIAAVALLADVPLGEMTSNILSVASEARSRTLGPFSPSFRINSILLEGLNSILPEDIHERVQGRLHVSLTKVYDGTNILVNQFSSREEVIQVVLASTFIPIFSGWLPPRYRGIRVIDGGYSDNLPVLDGQTITVSPFSGNSDICPQDDTAWKVLQVSVANMPIVISKENFYRLSRVLLPPEPEVLARVCKQGFEDTLRFLQKRYLISCTRCLNISSTYVIDEVESEPIANYTGCKEYDPKCLDCKIQRELASESSVPESVWAVFENAITEAEAGFTSWLKLLPTGRIIWLLTLPAAIPLHISGRILNRLYTLLPKLADDLKLKAAAEKLIEHLCYYMTSGGFIVKAPHHHARYTCEFNITQYGEDEDNLSPTSRIADRRTNIDSVKDILSVELRAELESTIAPHLPHSQEEAIKFQNDNLAAAVSSHSRNLSRAVSRITSRVPSRAVSRAVSRMGSRSSSMDSLYNLNGDAPDTIELIRQVSTSQSAVMAFYYTDADNQVKVTEIFDVTQTDPSLLIADEQGVNYSHENLHLPLTALNEDHFGGGRRRHGSGWSDSGHVSRRNSIINPMSRLPAHTNGTKEAPAFSSEKAEFLQESTSSSSSNTTSPTSSLESSFSDPESDWLLNETAR